MATCAPRIYGNPQDGGDFGHRLGSLGRGKHNAFERLDERRRATHTKYGGIEEIFTRRK